MWHLFEGETANELWAAVFAALGSNEDVRVQPSRAGSTREILHVALTLRNPRERWVSTRRPAMNPAFAIAEVLWILGGRRDARFLAFFNRSLRKYTGGAECLHGAYGHRLRTHFGIDQLESAYETLRVNPNSRQVVLQFWDPISDLPLCDGQPRDSDVPCNTQSILKVRDGRLEWVQIVRSNDVFLGLPHNLIQFTMLQEVLAGWLRLEVGHYHHISDSLHLYEHDTVSESSVDQSNQSKPDDFALERSESVRVIKVMVQCVDQIIDEDRTVKQICQLPSDSPLPDAYRDALRVLVAEGARRRGDLEAGCGVMAECSSKTLSRLWSNWCARLNAG